MELGRYAGQFLPQNKDAVAEALAWPTTEGYIWRLQLDVRQLLKNRPFADWDLIATRIESVIAARARRLAREQLRDMLFSHKHALAWPEEIEYALHYSQLSRAQQVQRLEVKTRRSFGDVDLWLLCGAEDAQVRTANVPAFPQNTTRAECLAVISLWKAFELDVLTRRVMQALSSSSVPPPAAEQPDTLLGALGDFDRIAHLSAEVNRAATMALDADLLDRELAQAQGMGAPEIEAALRKLGDRDVRHNGAKGGASRAAKYLPLKQRALELYQRGAGGGNRSAAAREIFKAFESEGLEVKYEFILKTLAAHDRAIVERRQNR